VNWLGPHIIFFFQLRVPSPCRNMVLQNESIDEELEHFEDVVEQ